MHLYCGETNPEQIYTDKTIALFVRRQLYSVQYFTFVSFTVDFLHLTPHESQILYY